ncbi:glutamate--cysteine ligase [Alteromonas aestuariivivens]|uniref:Glutamate--cysteine ligase n=1 Tax=Alteromonas aestuariivivens TaxID=1938339 RepID=A0A3D8M669_9ALTE|nr:glutamate--cysteine ligase [Alteromonas aestuariivivens]RDV25156.1 glutamate--cysteine ligase [Alteromonas aestuariivivens]
MTTTHTFFRQRIEALSSADFLSALSLIRRGVERETLRIQPSGKLACTPHPEALGSALTHESITTDFSESLLEFITSPLTQSGETLERLGDIHKYVYENIDGEWLWPLSMPCFIEDENDIPIAYFGESNVGKMKRVYRLGLKNRYGSMMQAIAGVHFNFSFSDEFWKLWCEKQGLDYSRDQVSAQYFALIRNYRRLCWLIPYLFGASPALCGSFLAGKSHRLPFQKVGKGTYYLPYATSLRMSDLGYTNAEQSALQICYNKLDNYVRLLRLAMETPSSRFTKFAAGEGGHYQQLSHNILQIENELYSPIRPKQPTESMEKPTDALVRRGVKYIEVRALDVNPFSPIGISQEQMDFLDVFLLTCLLLPSPEMTAEQLKESTDNLNKVVLEGRKPGLELSRDGEAITLQQWASDLLEHFGQAAQILDKANSCERYSLSVNIQRARVADPDKTLSGQLLQRLLANDTDNGRLGLELAQEYAHVIGEQPYRHTSAEGFAELARGSIQAQKEVEASDNKDFDTFIRDYFNEPPAKKMPG